MDDEVAVLFGNVLHWQTGYIARQAPVLPADREGFARKVKPFCRLYERETAAYTLITSIDYIYDECPHALGATSIRHKNILNQMEEQSPGTKAQFYLGFLRARKEGFFCEQLPSQGAELELHPCSNCGQPTSAPDLCAFCRLWKSAKQEDNMLHTPNSVLNEKEQELLQSAPEECLRHAVQRGAVALDEGLLSPRVAAVLQSIVTGERLSLPEQVPSSRGGVRTVPPSDREYERTTQALSEFPQLTRLVSSRDLAPDEAMQVAHAIDDILGRYLTGTRYAAP
jgi:uncharacterized protein (TIGR00269 family)